MYSRLTGYLLRTFKLPVFTVGVAILIFLNFGCNSSGTNIKSNSSIKTDTNISQIISKISPDSIKSDILKLVNFKTRSTISDTTSDLIGIGAARRWIYHKMKSYSERSGGRLKVRYMGYVQEPGERIDKPTRIVDVVATLPGVKSSSKDRIYVVSGHYDSRVKNVMDDTSFAPGAVDDGSGTAIVMEMARVMSHYKFDATLVFMTVAGEEQCLCGSKYFASQAKKKNLNIAAMFNNDMVGYGKTRTGEKADWVRLFASGVRLNGDSLSRYDRMLIRVGGTNDTPERELGRFIHNVAQEYISNFKVHLIYRSDRFFRSGDHIPFLKRGYPAIRFSQAYENFHHQHQYVHKENGIQYGDLPKFADFGYIAKIARVNASSFAMLANAPARPNDVRLVLHGGNNTTLSWKANQEPDVKGYVVVWRKTNAPYWQHQKFVGNVTKVTIPVSKDNYLFGVRAVDKLGYYSPAVYSLPSFKR